MQKKKKKNYTKLTAIEISVPNLIWSMYLPNPLRHGQEGSQSQF